MSGASNLPWDTDSPVDPVLTKGVADLLYAPIGTPIPPVVLRTPIANLDYTVLASDRMVAMTGITATRTWQLPNAATYPTGVALTLCDESGQLVPGGNTPILISVSPFGGQFIDGLSVLTLAQPYETVTLYSDGTSKWTTKPPEPKVTVMPASPFYTIKPADRILQVGAAATGYSCTLPLATTMPPYVPILVFDASGLGTKAKIVFNRTAPDTVNGLAVGAAGFTNKPFGWCYVWTDGVSKWYVYVVDQTAVFGTGNIDVDYFTTGFLPSLVYASQAIAGPKQITLPDSTQYRLGTGIRFIDFLGVVNPPNIWNVIGAGVQQIDGTAGARPLLIRAKQVVDVISVGNGWVTVQVGTPLGIADGSASPTGYVGELLENTSAAGIASANGVPVNTGTVTLTPGDWDVWGVAQFNFGGGLTISYVALTIGASGAATAFPDTVLHGLTNIVPPINIYNMISPIKTYNVTTNTAVFAVAQSGNSGAGVTVQGKIYARRRR